MRDADLDFLSITQDSITAMIEHRIPLGMNAREFENFCQSLRAAAQRDGVKDIDVRLQGSSARFFSGVHKKMSYDFKEVVQDFELERDRPPEELEVTQILERLGKLWPSPTNRPRRRPFDAYYNLGIARSRSDYDIQISSDSLVNRARQRTRILGEEYETRHPTYKFIKKGIVFEIAPHLEFWRNRQSDILRRNVTIAVFPGDGPERIDDNLLSSSHHRPTDWVVMRASADD